MCMSIVRCGLLYLYIRYRIDYVSIFSISASKYSLSYRFSIYWYRPSLLMTVVFGLGTRLRVRMCTTFENGVLRNGQQPVKAENSFIDQNEFVAMKTLSGRIAPRCDKHQFCDKMTVSTWTVFEISLLNGLKKERRRKMAVSQPHTLALSCFPRGFWARIWVLLITKGFKEED